MPSIFLHPKTEVTLNNGNRRVVNNMEDVQVFVKNIKRISSSNL